MDLAQAIRDARAAKGFSQRKLGKLVGRSGPAVAMWESGQTLPDVELRPALSQVLGIPLEVLMPEFAASSRRPGGLDLRVLKAALQLAELPPPVREAYLLQIEAMVAALRPAKESPPDRG